jgi:hypothetical protein
MEDEEVAQQLHTALGMAAVKLWSNLPQPLQQELFDAAVSFRGEAIRQALALFLHEHHTRTTAFHHSGAPCVALEFAHQRAEPL